MVIKFDLNIKPFSINRVFCRDMRHKTAEYRDWELSALETFRQPFVQEKLAGFRSKFNIKTDAISVRFVFKFPKAIYYNKAGGLSSKSMDLSNVEKTLLDVLCLPKYHVNSFPHGALNLNVDDKHVIQLHSYKIVSPSDKWQISVAVKIIPNYLKSFEAI